MLAAAAAEACMHARHIGLGPGVRDAMYILIIHIEVACITFGFADFFPDFFGFLMLAAVKPHLLLSGNVASTALSIRQLQ